MPPEVMLVAGLLRAPLVHSWRQNVKSIINIHVQTKAAGRAPAGEYVQKLGAVASVSLTRMRRWAWPGWVIDAGRPLRRKDLITVAYTGIDHCVVK